MSCDTCCLWQLQQYSKNILDCQEKIYILFRNFFVTIGTNENDHIHHSGIGFCGCATAPCASAWALAAVIFCFTGSLIEKAFAWRMIANITRLQGDATGYRNCKKYRQGNNNDGFEFHIIPLCSWTSNKRLLQFLPNVKREDIYNPKFPLCDKTPPKAAAFGGVDIN